MGTDLTSADLLGDPDVYSRAGVVHVALWVPERRLVLRLRGGGGVPGADGDLVLASREGERGAPVAPGPAAEVVEQLGLRPIRAAVDGDVDPRDVPFAARERVTAYLDRAGRDRVTVRRRENVGVERDQAERPSIAVPLLG